MHSPHRVQNWYTITASFLAGVYGIALIGSLSACSVDTPARRAVDQPLVHVTGPQATIVFIIHGDAGYRYQDNDGVTIAADEKVLDQAHRVAERNPAAEVFIFHQKPRRHVFFLFPLSDGDCWVYRNGRLVVHEAYDRSNGAIRFASETELFHRYSTGQQESRLSVFLYSGHEMPEADVTGYDASSGARTFSVRDLVAAMKSMSPPSGRFDLAVIATCYGGTPFTVGRVGSAARTIVASPDNLHLSSFDLQALEQLEPGMWFDDPHPLAQRFARAAFSRLTADVQTAVSVVVYDVDRVQPFLRSIADRKDPGSAQHWQADRCDCADLPEYRQPKMSAGVEVHFRPARFGRNAQRQEHSGWECTARAAASVGVSSPIKKSLQD